MQFVDTNILVYAHDRSADRKHALTQALVIDLWESKQGCVSIQVLQEFYVTVTRKVEHPLNPSYAADIVASLGVWNVHAPTVADIIEAIRFQQQFQLSFWDAMIVHSASRLGCHRLWSEDLNAGQYYGGVQVLNPFAANGR
jgi:predicted nucleic acid-binding protein